MKRILIYIIALAALKLAPVKGTDIGSLHPVEVILICRDGNDVLINTDTGDWGRGTDGFSALKNLKETTAGTIYLDTAEYLLIEEGTEEIAEQLRPNLKKTVRICMAEKKVDLKEAAAFLPVHSNLPKLKGWSSGDELLKLTVVEKRLKLS